MDTTLVNLKVISKLEPSVKLETDGVLFTQVEWSLFPESVRRWWTGQSRQNTINKIKQTYKNSFALINGDDNTTKSRVLEAMAESLTGLKNLKQTYAGDNTITSQIDVMIEDINSKINVNEEVFEKILKEWSEIGSSYRYLHDKAFQQYSAQNLRFALPVIIISTITGTANFAQGTFPAAWQSYVPLGIGTLNLAAGLITTIAQFLRVSELLEGHRAASISYSKFSRDISVELSLPVKERQGNGRDFVIKCRNELDRLIEQSPNIPQKIVGNFSKRFLKSAFVKPDILDIRAVEIYVPNEVEEQEKIIKAAEIEMKRRQSIIDEAAAKKQAIIDEYAAARKKTKAAKKQGISHIQNSMQKLISNLGGSTLDQPLPLSDSSTSIESDTIEIVVKNEDDVEVEGKNEEEK